MFIEEREKRKKSSLEISEENSLSNQFKNQEDILIKAKSSANKCIYSSIVFGFSAGLIPIPYLELVLLYALNLGMILKIANIIQYYLMKYQIRIK